jgi:hypothetical protein
LETSAAVAMSLIETGSKPRARNSEIAASAMASRVRAFFRARSPVGSITCA